jgi:hypothetical protein
MLCSICKTMTTTTDICQTCTDQAKRLDQYAAEIQPARVDESSAELAAFVAMCQAKIAANHESNKFTFPQDQIECEFNPKYVRVMRVGNASRSAHCFVDRVTGQIFKPAGFKGPEKKNPRGSIYNPDCGAGAVTCYGTTYLR